MPDTLDLGRLEKLLAEATPGPWTCDGPSDNVIVWGAKIDTRVCFMTSDGKAAQNATLIVAAVNALPHLLSRISELESALRGVKAEAIDIAKASAKRCAYKGNNPYIAACLKHRRSDARRIAREIEAIDLDTQARNVLGEKA